MTLKKLMKNFEMLPVVIKLAALVVVLTLISHIVFNIVDQNDISQNSVMVVNSKKTNGGTGVILRSTDLGSTILTNSHVCKVIQKGGLVIHNKEEHRVFSFKHSKTHDLCLITVKSNLHVNTVVANHAPILFNEKAFISGHPNLLPTVVTSGHFSSKAIIQVLTGMRKCTEEDMKKNPIVCLFLGGFPIVKEYEATLVSATIMPGSSGSGVYNQSLELSGLAFAGSKDLSYAWTVPFEDLKFFLDQESKVLQEEVVPADIDLGASDEQQTQDDFVFEKLKEACSSKEDAVKLGVFCDIIKHDSLWRG